MTSPREKRKRSGVEPTRLLAAVPLGKATAARRQHRGSSGTGKGKNYKPWIRVHDISSLGKSTRCRGRKTDRTHTFFSDLEYHFFLLLEWDDSVVDIQEQYPLFPQAEIEQIANALGVKVPHIVGEKAPMTMTTDFLVTTKIGKEAWSIKPARALEKRRTLEKLEIERIYWDRRGFSFGISTEKEMPAGTLKNLRWIRAHRGLEGPLEDIEIVREYMEPKLEDVPLGRLARECDGALGMAAGKSMEAVKGLLRSKQWKVDIRKEISTSKTLRIIS